jgi:hypothetical protein
MITDNRLTRKIMRRPLLLIFGLLLVGVVILWVRGIEPTSSREATLSPDVFRALPTNADRRVVITLLGTPTFDYQTPHLPVSVIPIGCKSQVTRTFVYYRKPPKTSYYVLFDASDRLVCKAEMHMLAAF